jgi:hypothetical protein
MDSPPQVLLIDANAFLEGGRRCTRDRILLLVSGWVRQVDTLIV